MILYLASFLNLFLLFLFFIINFARPISYADSWTFMTYNNYDSNSTLIHYSPTSKYSVGYKSEYWQSKEYFLNSLNLNYLIKRINKKFSQANVYLKSGHRDYVIRFENNDSKNELAGHLEVALIGKQEDILFLTLVKPVKSESR